MQLIVRSACCGLLTLPLVCQEAPTRAETPMLVFESADHDFIEDAARSFGLRDGLPMLADDGYYVLSLGGDKKPELAAAVGASGSAPGSRFDRVYFELTADPARLMAAYAEEVEDIRRMVQGVVIMAFTPQGFETKDVMRAVKEAFEVPYQIEQFHLVVKGNPDNFEDEGLDLAFSLTAKAGTTVGQLFSATRVGDKGAPVLGESSSMLDLKLSLDARALPALLAPFMDWSLALSYAPEAREAARALSVKMINEYDGTMSYGMDAQFGMNGLVGFEDGEAIAEIVDSPEYAAMVRAQQSPVSDIDIEYTPNAFEYEGFHFHKMMMFNDGPPNPMMPDDEMTQIFGAVGNYLLMAGSVEHTKSLADQVRAGKLTRVKLADGAVMTMAMDLRAFMSAMSGLPDAANDMPTGFKLAVIPRGRTLSFDVSFR